jgi:hypothetical protein
MGICTTARPALAGCLYALAATAGAATGAAEAQTPGDTVVVVAGAQYEAGATRRLLHGSNWRAVWVQPVRVPVLDVRAFAGGLTPLRRGGGSQSITLHMEDARGDRWLFRSIDKHPERGLPPGLRDAPAGFIITDHVSMLHPGGHFITPPLLEAVGVLHVLPQLFVMPDDEALGEYREDYAGMLGQLERRANQGPGGTPGFAGSRRVRSTNNFLDDLEESQQHRPDEREFFRARLIDFLVGDPDRGTDQWRWARFGEAGDYTWRPIPVDRDWALARADGVVSRFVGGFYGKLVHFGPSFSSLDRLTYSTHIMDRRMLTRLTRQDAAEEALRVQAALTDAVIDRAVAAMPAVWAAESGDEIVASLRARRERIPEIAAEFYGWLATEVDVRGTDEADLVEAERRADGTVRVRIGPRPDVADASRRAADAATYYDRVFHPDETREVRVYMHGGPDHARVTGTPAGPIVLRIIGGGGDDLLEDLAGGTRFYDHRGDNRVVYAAGTRFDDTPWSPPAPPEGVRANLEWAPDWGGRSGVSPAADYHERAGVLLGAEANVTRYGFRRLPHRWSVDVRGLYAPESGSVVATLEFDQRMPNSRRGTLLEVSASTLEKFRFHGFGNDSPDAGPEVLRIGYHQLRVAPSLTWYVGPRPGRDRQQDAPSQPDDDDDDPADGTPIQWTPTAGFTEGRARVGAMFGWSSAPRTGVSPQPVAVAAEPAVTQLGASAGLYLARSDRPAVPRRGFRFDAVAAAFPLVSAGGAFGTVNGSGALYLPLPGDGPHLALRATGAGAFGDFPLFEAAFLGGRHSIRGLPSDRLAGEGSVSGTVEVRVPIDTLTLLFRGETGVFVFADAGRVWHRGASPGKWHSGHGAGAWFAVLGQAVSVAIARGDATRAYAWLGLPF